jgi:tetratricopeptide (TPR) repeat protein
MQPAMAISAADRSWKELQKSGTDALDANQYWIAEPTLKEALIKAGAFGLNDVRMAESLGELGRLYRIRGRFAEAEPYFEEQLHVKELAVGYNSGKEIPDMAALIQFYLNYGTASKADPLTEEMLALVEGKLKEPEHHVGKLKVKKGVPLEGWVGEAAPVMRDPLIEWAIACDAVGEAYYLHGKYDLAERAFKAGLDMKTEVLGRVHLAIASSYDSLGKISQAREDYSGAELYFRNALDTTERILPTDNPQVYARLDRLAHSLVKTGKYSQAAELYLGALDFWKKAPSKSGDEPRALYALGSVYLDQKNYSAAARYLRQALQLAEENNGPASVLLTPYLQRYAYCLYFLKQKHEMEALKARANTISGGM